MPQEIAQEGHGRGRIAAYKLFESNKTGSVSVKITLAVDEWWNPETGEYEDWRKYEVVANGDNWIVGRKGEVINSVVKNLVEVMGWDGNPRSVILKTWQPKPVSFAVEQDEEEYNGKRPFKAKWFHAYEEAPGGGSVSDDRLNELVAKFGPQLREIAGNVAAAKPAPAGKPAAPQAPPGARPKPQPRPRPAATAAAAPVAAPQEPAAEAPAPQDDIPF